jgi:mannose-1-phosphate guanylyltransferase
MKAVLLSGGFGTRLRPLTLSQPKAVLPLLNKPFCLYPLEWLARHGVRNVTFATGYRSASLAKMLTKEKPRGVSILLKVEKRPLGTGGALRRASMKGEERFFVLNGDILTRFDLSKMLKFHLKKKAILTLALVNVPDISRYGSVSLRPNGEVKRFIEKQPGGKRKGWVNAGVYIFEPEAIRRIPAFVPCSLERDFFPRMARERRGLFGFPIHGYWKDVGTIASYEEAHHDLFKSVSRRLLIGKGTRIGRGVQLIGDVSIGRRCRIGDGARIQNSIVLDDVRIGKGTQVTESILSYRCRIGDHSALEAGTILGEGSHVSQFSRC